MPASLALRLEGAMLRFAVGLKPGVHVTQLYLQKPLKMRFWRKISHRKNYEIQFWKNSWPRRFTFCVQISLKSSAGKRVKGCIVLLIKKFTKCVFLAPFCARSIEDAKRLQRSVPCDSTSLCKILSQSVPICRSYSRKSDFVQSQYTGYTFGT